MNKLAIVINRIPLVGWLLRQRFVRFGTVGFSGTLINLGMLYLGQEYIFRMIEDNGIRLDLSLGLAIFCATINNFTWNRIWTWHDRQEKLHKSFIVQLLQYFFACMVAIALQFTLTKLLANHMHYMAANVSAIVLASLVNYLINDFWTFAVRKLRPRKPACKPKRCLQKMLAEEL